MCSCEHHKVIEQTEVMFSVAQQPKSGLSCLNFLGCYKLDTHAHTHTHTHSNTQSAASLWMSDHLVTESATYTTSKKPKRQTSLSSTEFEPETPATKRLHTYALDCTTTGIGELRTAKLIMTWEWMISFRLLPLYPCIKSHRTCYTKG